jgi:predicted nucleic acid-binding protein
MRLDRVEGGSEVFIDANIFIYHFTGVSDQSSHFLSRCEAEDLRGITCINVLLEVLHRLMMIEAIRRNLVQPPNIVKKLRKSPQKIKQLSEYFINTQKIPEMGIIVKPVSNEAILRSQIYRAGYGLMVNDSLIVTCMEEEGIKGLASNDDGFLKVPGLSVYKPTDVIIE